MPGSISNAAPATTMPWSLCAAFRHSREYPLIENTYKDGENQRSLQAQTSRKRWAISMRLTPTALLAMRAFYNARSGPYEPFYFYDHTETVPKYDSTPSGATGRYTVRFDGLWEQACGPARADVTLAIIQLA